MPIYSYRCRKCGKTFDKFQKVNGNGNTKCIYCNSETHRIYSPAGIIFKGSGFYSTDYKLSSKSPGSNTSISRNKENNNKELNKKPKNESSGEKMASSVSDKK